MRKYTVTVTVIPSNKKKKISRRGDLLWCMLSKDAVRGIWFHAFGQNTVAASACGGGERFYTPWQTRSIEQGIQHHYQGPSLVTCFWQLGPIF